MEGLILLLVASYFFISTFAAPLFFGALCALILFFGVVAFTLYAFYMMIQFVGIALKMIWTREIKTSPERMKESWNKSHSWSEFFSLCWESDKEALSKIIKKVF